MPESCDVFVINLERAADRRARMSAVLEHTGIPFTFFPAVDGRALSEKDLAHYDRAARLSKYYFDLAPGEIGCYLSHLYLIRSAYEQGKSRILILEDDVEPGPDFVRLVEHCRSLPQGYDMIKLYGMRRRSGKVAARIDRTYSLIRPYNVTTTSAAYFLDREGMRKILEYGSRITMPYDMMIDCYWESGLRIFAIDPFPVSRAEVQSTIAGRDLDPWRTMKNGTAARLRRRLRKAVNSALKLSCNLRIAAGLV